MFGPRGPASLLSQATTVVAVLFMVTSISLSYYSSRKIQKNINIEDELQRLQSAEQIMAPIPEIKPEDKVDEEAVSE